MTKYQEFILKKFKNYIWPEIEIKNECNKVDSSFKLNPTQRFVSNYIQPTNENGILLWHSVGSGKTLSALAILRNFEKQGYNTLWVTRKSLKKDLEKGMKFIQLKKPLTVLSYKQFSNLILLKTKIYDYLLERARKLDKNTNDPLYKTILIIDEAHKLYGDDLLAQESHDIKIIENMLYNSYKNTLKNRCKLVLLTATPILDEPEDIIKLLSLLIVNEKDRFDINTFKNEYLTNSGTFTSNGLQKFKLKTQDLVSYIDMSKDPRKFAQVNYQEILVPISAPSFDNILKNGKKECEDTFKYCTELGIPVSKCNAIKTKCLKELNTYKNIAKNYKYQSLNLESKCKFKIV